MKETKIGEGEAHQNLLNLFANQRYIVITLPLLLVIVFIFY